MFKNSVTGLDSRKWFDRMFPQTLAIATWLLYIDGAFALLRFLDRTDMVGFLRATGGFYSLFALASTLSYIAAGFLMANGKLLGWYLGIFASFSPMISRFLIAGAWSDTVDYTLRWRITGNDTVGFLFEAALVALLLHSMSRTHVRRWFR